jgi:tRNA(fMet)-specific endonuclease VapC
MILLDTDILSLYHAGHERVAARIKTLDRAEVLGTTVITFAEILRARFEFLLKAADGEQLQKAQQRLDGSQALLDDMHIAKVDVVAASAFDELRRRKRVKDIGHADLLIASIALANDATLVTRNLKHFRQVPNLKVENWVD